eukprot:5071579-Prymnesium_polylepis.2
MDPIGEVPNGDGAALLALRPLVDHDTAQRAVALRGVRDTGQSGGACRSRRRRGSRWHRTCSAHVERPFAKADLCYGASACIVIIHVDVKVRIVLSFRRPVLGEKVAASWATRASTLPVVSSLVTVPAPCDAERPGGCKALFC